TILVRNGSTLVYSDHRRAAGLHRSVSIDPHANVGCRDRLVRQLVRCEVGDDLFLVPNDAGWSDAEKVIGVDAAERDHVGGDLRVNPLLVLLPNSLLRVHAVGRLPARPLRDGGNGCPQQTCSAHGDSPQGTLLAGIMAAGLSARSNRKSAEHCVQRRGSIWLCLASCNALFGGAA